MLGSFPQALRLSSASAVTSSKLAREPIPARLYGSAHLQRRGSDDARLRRYAVPSASSVASLGKPSFGHAFTNSARSSSSRSMASDASPIAQISKQRYEALIESEIVHFASALTPHPITLQQILGHDHADSLREFLLEELPIRYARRLRLIESLEGWQNFPHMRVIRTMYSDAFRRLRMITHKDAEPFRKCLTNIRRRHSHILQHVIRGTREMKAVAAVDEETIDKFLNDFNTAKVGTDLLLSHYLAIVQSSKPVIDPQLDPVALIQEAAEDARDICNAHYGRTPSVQIYEVGNVTFPFIPSYMNYIIYELLKNALRAVVERHTTCTDYPVTVTVCGDDSTVVIRISDAGGGIAHEELPRVWSYNYSTATAVDKDLSRLLDDDSDNEHYATPMAGFGVGLPLSRTYATYVGGRLELNTMPHYGTDAYLYLNRIGNAEEQLVFPSRGYLHENV